MTRLSSSETSRRTYLRPEGVIADEADPDDTSVKNTGFVDLNTGEIIFGLT